VASVVLSFEGKAVMWCTRNWIWAF